MTPLEQALARSPHLSAIGQQVFTVWFLTGVDDVEQCRDTESRYLKLSRSPSPAAAEAGYLVGLISTRRANIPGTLPLHRGRARRCAGEESAVGLRVEGTPLSALPCMHCNSEKRAA